MTSIHFFNKIRKNAPLFQIEHSCKNRTRPATFHQGEPYNPSKISAFRPFALHKNAYTLYNTFEKEFDLLAYGGKRDLDNIRKSPLWKQILKDGIVVYDQEGKIL